MRQNIEELLSKIQFEIRRISHLGIDFFLESTFTGKTDGIRKRQHSEFKRLSKVLINKNNSDYSMNYTSTIKLNLHDEIKFEDSLLSNLSKRLSNSDYHAQPAKFEEVSFLLKTSAGIKTLQKKSSNRFYPSGGALYTIRTYVYMNNVDNIRRGLYLYNPTNDTINLINHKVSPEDLALCVHNTEPAESFSNSSFVIFFSTKPMPAIMKYGDHGIKIILMECGALMQNFNLIVTGLGFNSRIISGINIKNVNRTFRTSHRYELFMSCLLVGK